MIANTPQGSWVVFVLSWRPLDGCNSHREGSQTYPTFALRRHRGKLKCQGGRGGGVKGCAPLCLQQVLKDPLPPTLLCMAWTWTAAEGWHSVGRFVIHTASHCSTRLTRGHKRSELSDGDVRQDHCEAPRPGHAWALGGGGWPAGLLQ